MSAQSSLVFDKEGQPMSESKVGTVVEAKAPDDYMAFAAESVDVVQHFINPTAYSVLC